jgi:hypothetical protein
VAKLLEYLLSDSPRARSPTLTIPPTLLARANEVIEYAISVNRPCCTCSGPLVALSRQCTSVWIAGRCWG